LQPDVFKQVFPLLGGFFSLLFVFPFRDFFPSGPSPVRALRVFGMDPFSSISFLFRGGTFFFFSNPWARFRLSKLAFFPLGQSPVWLGGALLPTPVFFPIGWPFFFFFDVIFFFFLSKPLLFPFFLLRYRFSPHHGTPPNPPSLLSAHKHSPLSAPHASETPFVFLYGIFKEDQTLPSPFCP